MKTDLCTSPGIALRFSHPPGGGGGRVLARLCDLLTCGDLFIGCSDRGRRGPKAPRENSVGCEVTEINLLLDAGRKLCLRMFNDPWSQQNLTLDRDAPHQKAANVRKNIPRLHIPRR